MGMDSKGVPRVLRPLKFQPLVKLGQVLKMVKPLDRCLEETMLVGVLLQLVPLDKMLKATVLNNILSIPLLWRELPRSSSSHVFTIPETTNLRKSFTKFSLFCFSILQVQKLR